MSSTLFFAIVALSAGTVYMIVYWIVQGAEDRIRKEIAELRKQKEEE